MYTENSSAGCISEVSGSDIDLHSRKHFYFCASISRAEVKRAHILLVYTPNTHLPAHLLSFALLEQSTHTPSHTGSHFRARRRQCAPSAEALVPDPRRGSLFRANSRATRERLHFPCGDNVNNWGDVVVVANPPSMSCSLRITVGTSRRQL